MKLFLMVKAATLSLGNDCAGHTVWEMLLDTGGKFQELVFGAFIKADDTFDMRYGFGQSTRLVKNNEIGRSELLEIFTAFDGHAKIGSLIHCTTHGHRCRQLNGTRIIDHQHRHGLLNIACYGEKCKKRRKVIRNQRIGQTLGL